MNEYKDDYEVIGWKAKGTVLFNCIASIVLFLFASVIYIIIFYYRIILAATIIAAIILTATFIYQFIITIFSIRCGKELIALACGEVIFLQKNLSIPISEIDNIDGIGVNDLKTYSGTLVIKTKSKTKIKQHYVFQVGKVKQRIYHLRYKDFL